MKKGLKKDKLKYSEFTLWLLLWWHYDIEMHSILLAICEGNPMITGGFPSQRATRDVERSWFLCYQPEQTDEKAVKLPMVWATMSLMWLLGNAKLIQWLLCSISPHIVLR